MSTALELLAPAGTAEIGMAAIDHGADAVYIGAPQFSARAQAGQAIADIARLVDHAHFFHARVYVALNTILSDEEIPQALEIIRSLDSIGVDGLIIQDVGLLEFDLPAIPLIASTQMHNVTPARVKFLEEVGFQKVVLARELSLDDIGAIRAQTRVELEAFVHGALCVSYSGQCYMSQFSCGRSANRGLCAQPCRHSYTLQDGDGKTLLVDKHLLSLKDMNRLDSLAGLIAAGVTSFKIEGRYKDSDYVKNITAAYRLALDGFIAEHPGYKRASSGTCTFDFNPDPAKTFNRGYTSYFLEAAREQPGSINTPKSMGQFIGRVESVGRDYFLLAGHDLHNGDGLCFLSENDELTGCRVDKVAGERIYPGSMKELRPGTEIYRNLDTAFSRILKKSINCRTLRVTMDFFQEEGGILLKVVDEDGVSAEHRQEAPFEKARDPERARDAIKTQLCRSGGTPYQVERVTIHPAEPGFLPLSLLNELRRQALAMLSQTRKEQYPRPRFRLLPTDVAFPESEVDFHANVANRHAEKFYQRHGVEVQEWAWEMDGQAAGKLGSREVITSRYCLLYQLGACLQGGKGQKKLKLPLRISDRGQVYRLEFDCKQCRMRLIPEGSTGPVK